MRPSAPPKQEASKLLFKVIVGAGASAMTPLETAVHPLTSLTVTVYVPLTTLVI